VIPGNENKVIPDKCVNSGLLNDIILVKTNGSIVVYWIMILWLKKCVNGGLLNDDILIKTKWLDTGITLI
jgi:hypothetical protein